MTPSASRVARALAAVEARYRARHPESARLHAAAAQHMPGGNTRTVLHYSPFPLRWASGRENRLTCVDGFDHLDLLGEYSAGLYGHSNAIIQAAIKRAVDEGLALGGPNLYEARLAAAICARFPSLELVRFTNSGTEANLMALSTVRALAPRRPRVLVFNGGYHGGVFYFREGGSILNAPFDWLIGEYNDTEGTRALIRTHAATIAAVLVEPLQGGGCIPGAPEFLQMLRDECTAQGIVLIFDEVMTSRLAPAGLQGALGIRPDMTTLGKYLGGGASFGAFGGRRDLLERFDPASANAFSHAGTFNNNVLSMAAGLAGLTQVFTPEEALRLNALGDRLRERLNEVAAARAAPLEATGRGSLIGLHVRGGGHPEAARAQLDTLLHLDMLDRGFYFARRGYIALSLPTTRGDCENFASAVDDFLAEHAALMASTA
jgi:glutamate-1-semialdehyde 2,1-aminomutase